MIRSSRLATVRPSIPSPRNERHAERQPRPERVREARTAAARAAAPSAGPSSRPTTAVTNSAVESCSIWRISQTAGTTVRYGRIAKPTTTQATTQATSSQPPPGDSLEEPRRGGQCEPDEATEGRTEQADVADHVFPRVVPLEASRRRALGSPKPPYLSIAPIPPPRDPDRAAHRPRQRRHRSPHGGCRPPRSPGPARSAPADRERRSRDDRPTEPEPRRLAQPALEPGDGAQLAEQADLADRHRARPDRPVAQRRGEGERERQVEAGLVDRQAAGQVDVDVVACEADPGPPAEDGDEQRDAVRRRRRWRVRRGVPPGPGATSAWTSTRSGREPSSVGATTLPGAGAVVLGEERPGRVGDLGQSGLAHLEDADLLGRSEAVLRRAQQADRPRSARRRGSARRRRDARASSARRSSRPS